MKSPKFVKYMSTALYVLDITFLAYILAVTPLWFSAICVIIYLLFGRSLDNYFNTLIFIFALIRDLLIVPVNSYLPFLILTIGIVFQFVVYKIFYTTFVYKTCEVLISTMSEFERCLLKQGKKPTLHQFRRSMQMYEKIYKTFFENGRNKFYESTGILYASPEVKWDEEDSLNLGEEDNSSEDDYFLSDKDTAEIHNGIAAMDMCCDIIKQIESELPDEYISAKDIISDKFYDFLYEHRETPWEEKEIYFTMLNICFQLISSGDFHKSQGELDENTEAPALCLVFDTCIAWLKESGNLSEKEYDNICTELQKNINSRKPYITK